MQVISLGDAPDLGLDVLVTIGDLEAKLVVPCFGVDYEATNDDLPTAKDATQYMNRKWKHRKHSRFLLFPAVVFLFSMVDDKGYYSWLMEPIVSVGADPRLSPVENLRMASLDKGAVDNILKRVLTWAVGMEKVIEREEKAVKDKA